MSRGREKKHATRNHRGNRGRTESSPRTSFCIRWALGAAALPDNFIEHDSGCDRYIQRRYFAEHRDRDQEIAFALYQIVQALAFAAQDQRAVHVVVEGVVGLLGTLVEANSPNI